MTSDKFLTRAVLIVCKSHIPSAIDLKAIMGDFLLQSSLELQKRFGNFVNICLTDFTCRLWELLLLENVWLWQNSWHLNMNKLLWFCQEHTDRFLVEMFHNYTFKECISVENLKLWLLILTKTLFLMTILIKLTLGNIFINVKKSNRAAPLSQNS